jgi:general secretion pathway protein D
MERAVATNFYTPKGLTFQGEHCAVLESAAPRAMEARPSSPVLAPARAGTLAPTSGMNTRRYTALRETLGRVPVPGYNRDMRGGKFIRLAFILLAVIGMIPGLAASAFCRDQPTSTPLLPCPEGSPGAVSCNPSKKELKEASAAFTRGLKRQREKRQDEAFDQFETAARLAPRDVGYVTARELTRQQVVFDHLERGNEQMRNGRQIEALAEFRTALHLDPQNEFARQRLKDALGEWAPKTAATPQVAADAGEIRVAPSAAQADFHYRGDGRGLLAQVASAFGVTATFDESVISRQVRFDIGRADFYSAMAAACQMTHTFWTPLDDKQILLAAESAQNHRQFDRMALRTFSFPGVTSPQELNDVVNLLRNLFEIRLVTPQARTSTIVVRAPRKVLDAATRLLEGLGDSRPQVMLDVHVYEITNSLTRNMGLQIPNNFQLFNIPAGALAALAGQNIQDLINQLISSGGINQSSSQALSGLLAQLQGQQSSVFSQPLATFGGGLTLSGLSLGTAGARLSLNESTVKTLEHATLRVSQGSDATFRVGTKYPILNASFAPVFNTPAIASVIQNNSFQSPFPSFNYEDIGLSVKAKPRVNGNSDVSLDLEIQFRALQGQSLNGVPVISNREYKGSINLMNGEPAVVAGAVSHSEQRSLNGIPGLGAVPGLNQVMTSNSKQLAEDELLIVITPRVISREQNQNAEVWMQK